MKRKKLKKIRKGFLSVLLVLTMLAGMLPLSVISANAGVKITDDFAKAFTFASNLSGQWYGNNYTAYLVSNAVRDCGYTAYVSANSISTSTTKSQISNIPGVTTLTNPSYSSLNDGYTYAVFGNSDYSWFAGIYKNGTMIYNSSATGVSVTTSFKPGLSVAYKHVTTTVTDDTQNVGDEFYAYINIVGNYYNYGKMLSVDPDQHLWQWGPPSLGGDLGKEFTDTKLVIFDSPNYSDTKQIWRFKRTSDTDGCYYLVQNVDTGWYLNVYQGGNYNVCLTEGNGAGASNYKWSFIKKPSNYYGVDASKLTAYGLRPKCYKDSKELHVYGTTSDNIRVADITNNRGNSEFFIQKIYDKVNTNTLASIKCRLDKYNGTYTNNNTCVGIDDNESVCYKSYDLINKPKKISSITWKFERVNQEGNYPAIYRIRHEKTGKYLQVGKQAVYTDNISVGTLSEGDTAQQWILLGENENDLNFVPVYHSNKKYAFYKTNTVDNKNNDKENGKTWTVNRDTEVVLSMDTPSGDNSEGKNIQCGAYNFEHAQDFKITYETTYTDVGDFYSSIISTVSLDDGYTHAVSLSKDGLDTNGDSYGNEIAGVAFKTISKNPAADQQWYFKSLGDGSYAIQNMATGYYLYKTDIIGTNNNNNYIVAAKKSFTRSDKEKWYLVQETEDTYSIRTKTDFNKLLNAYGNNLSDNTIVSIHSKDTSAASRWILDFNTTAPAWGENLGDTFWAYVSSVNYSNKYLQCQDTAGSQLNFVTIDNEEAKRKQENYWKFERNADGSYTISSCNLQNQELDCVGAFNTTTDSRKIVMYSDKAFDDTSGIYNHRWFIRKYANGYRLESKMTGQVVTITENSEAKAEWLDTSNSNQLLNITKTDLTVSTDMPYVKMHLFNYGRAINTAEGAILPFFNGSSGKYVDSVDNDESYLMKDLNPTMGNTLVNGYPYVEDNNIKESDAAGNGNVDDFVGKSGSLKYLFDTTKDFVAGTGNATSYKLPSSNYTVDSDYQSQCFKVNNPASLFKINDTNGLYYYDSLMNAAYFQRDTDSNGRQLTTGNFKLYDYTLSLSNTGYSTGQDTVTGVHAYNGNFFPFNLAHEEGDVSYGTDGARPTITSTVATDNDYFSEGDNVPVNYKLYDDTAVDAGFGMTLENTFVQTEGGTFNGKDLQFSFKGDDDVWIYVDGILVVDIGGTHGAQTGSINFRTGEVISYHPIKDSNGNELTNLKAIYQAVVNEKGSFTYNGVTINQAYINNNFANNTFKADTKHTLNFYYMERGGYVSSCQLKFNLPKGSISVTNNVTDLNSDFEDPREYTYQLQNEDGTPFTLSSSGPSEIIYLYEKADGTTEEKKMAIGGANECKFKLKSGESVIFQDIPNGEKFKVVPIDIPAGMEVSSTITIGKEETQNYLNGNYVDSNGNVASIRSNSSTQITYNNKLKDPKTLTIKKDVLDANNGSKGEMPGSTYYIGLHIFDKDKNGNIVCDYGTKTITIPGNTIIRPQVISGLPGGASFELWEYVPDDSVNRYDSPTLSDYGENGTINFKARLVETESTPALNDFISGTVNGQNITVVNKIVDPYSISVTFKYYDRETISGKPVNINSRETSYSQVVSLKNYSGFDAASNKIITSEGKQLLENIIFDVSARAETTGAIRNVVDEYEVFTSQQTAARAIAGRTYTLGDVDNYATHVITTEEAVYHTNSQRQPFTNTYEREKWITYYQSGKAVDAEASSFVDYDDITNITVWLYNTPREYTVKTHIPDSNGEDVVTTYTAYYNQQLGVDSSINLDECISYCKEYSIPLNEYKTLGSVNSANEENSNLSAPEKDSTGKDFSCWTDKSGNVLSTNLIYNYRVTGDLEIFAKYGDSVGKGVVSTDGGIDVYYDSSGTKRLRINTIMNPYGFEFGTDRGNPDIKYAAAAYLILEENVSTTTVDENIASIKTKIEETAENIAKGLDSNNKTGTASVTISGIGEIKVVVYEASESKLLTNKNRLHFMAGFVSPKEDNEVKTVLAFTSLYYNDGKAASSDNKWYISNNYVKNELTNRIGM